MSKDFGRRVKTLEERDNPTTQEIIDYLNRPIPLPGDAALAARIERNTPAYLRRMSNEELIAFVVGSEPGGEIE
jgi:hypothetical protein